MFVCDLELVALVLNSTHSFLCLVVEDRSKKRGAMKGEKKESYKKESKAYD